MLPVFYPVLYNYPLSLFNDKFYRQNEEAPMGSSISSLMVEQSLDLLKIKLWNILNYGNTMDPIDRRCIYTLRSWHKNKGISES